jgi:hypothetical protein
MKTLFTFLLLAGGCSLSYAQDTISAVDASKYINKKVTVCDRVNYGKRVNVNKNTPTVLYVGPDYPNHHLALYFPKNVVRRFSFDPEKKMINKRFCASGKITLHENKPAIIIRRESQVNEEEVNSYIFESEQLQ